MVIRIISHEYIPFASNFPPPPSLLNTSPALPAPEVQKDAHSASQPTADLQHRQKNKNPLLPTSVPLNPLYVLSHRTRRPTARRRRPRRIPVLAEEAPLLRVLASGEGGARGALGDAVAAGGGGARAGDAVLAAGEGAADVGHAAAAGALAALGCDA